MTQYTPIANIPGKAHWMRYDYPWTDIQAIPPGYGLAIKTFSNPEAAKKYVNALRPATVIRHLYKRGFRVISRDNTVWVLHLNEKEEKR